IDAVARLRYPLWWRWRPRIYSVCHRLRVTATPTARGIFMTSSDSQCTPSSDACEVGIKLTHLLAISKVDRGCDAERVLQYGDLITHMNSTRLSNRRHLESVFNDISKDDVYEVELKIVRLVVSLPLKAERLPRGFEQVAGYKYHVAVVYLIMGCKLALAVKSFNNKVYITRVAENTLSSMSLSIGDAVLDVDSVPVTSVNDATKIICSRLKANGYVTMTIERADDPTAAQYVRMALLTEKTMEIDLPLAPDVVDICRKELRRFCADPNLSYKCSILKTTDRKERTASSRIKINESTEDVPVACEDNPNLLVKVPAHPPKPPWFQQQQQRPDAKK
uniref:PDZ domain-containing protein n=1 Tax=Parascaris univalens TaxID=6257 RepID=A0A915A1B4_PARUN